MIGTLVNGRYRLEARLGQGGMGVVYRGHDLLLERDVVVKVLNEVGLGSEGRVRLLNEARAAARLNHPNIVSIYDAGETDKTPYIVMELVEGEALSDQRPESLDDLRRISEQICQALAHAHANGIIHRDLKPENVLVTPQGQVKLTDFGLARSLASRVTTEGTIVGTVYYLAPEIILGRPLDGRADLYALGVMMYDLATGRPPFAAEDAIAVISQHIHAPVVPPHTYRPDLPPALEAVILKLLAKDPNDRYQTAQAVQAALKEAAAGVGPLAGAETEDAGRLLEQLARGRLVGRREELEHLQRLWKASQQGHAQLALVSGEPGIGKTRLAHELVVFARLGGAVILRGGCYEYEAATPYLPFVEALREWVRNQNEAELNEHLDGLAVELNKLAPEIEARLGPLPPNLALSPNEERLRLFDHISRFLNSLAREHGLLVFIDDIHWSDQGTLALLHYLLRHLRETRMMVVACYREVELDRTHPFAAALVEWNRERLAVRLALNRLSREEVDQLLAALFGLQSSSNEFTEAVFYETEGNPFFIEEVIKALIEQGQIYREDGRWQRRGIHELAIPQSIKEAVGRRLDRQSTECIEILHIAAGLGKRFTFSELAAVASVGENDLLDRLDEASDAQLVRPEGGEAFVFTHDKIREVLYEELNPIRRRRLHLRIGENLEQAYQSVADVRPISPASGGERGVQTLAHHFIEAGDLERGLKYAIQAAEKARQIYALDEALRYYQRALECADALQRQDQSASLWEQIGLVQLTRGDFHHAEQAFERALELVETPLERARLHTHLGNVLAQRGDQRGRVFLEQALAELGEQADPLELARVNMLLGRFHHLHAEWDQALEFLERARLLAEPLDDVVVLGDVYAYLAGVYQWNGNVETSMYWARQNIALGERTGNPVCIAQGYEFLAEDCCGLNRWAEALEYVRLERSIADKISSLSRTAWALNASTHAYLGMGELDRAMRSANECLQIVERTGEERLGVLIYSMRARIYASMGEHELAVQDADYVEERAQETGLGQYQIWNTQSRVSVLFASQRWQELADYLDQSSERVRDRHWLEYLIACIFLDRRSLVEAFLQKKSGLLEPGDEQPDFIPWFLLLAAMLQGYLGDRPAAEQAYEKALVGLQEKGARLDVGLTCWLRACLRQSGNDLVGSRQDAGLALEYFSACGAKAMQARAQEMLDSLGVD